MAESRRYGLNPKLDIEQMLAEAQNRWLRPSEICEILRNYQKFHLAPDPPYKPPGGSLFLFDRKALRYFRKDGHCWRKKKDGKTVREAHEKLKAGSVDVLHCYYAHGEDNENFQRRSYWMLDGQLEHIVLVHYREVKEGSRSGISRLLYADPGTLNQSVSSQPSSTVCSSQAHSPAFAAQVSYSSPSTADWNGRTPSSEYEDVDSGDDFGASSLARLTSSSGFQTLHASDRGEDKCILGGIGATLHPYTRGSTDAASMNNGLSNPFYANQIVPLNLILNEGHPADYGASQEAGLFGGTAFSHASSSPMWSEVLGSNGNSSGMYDTKFLFEQPNTAISLNRKHTNSKLDSIVKDEFGFECKVFPETHVQAVTGDAQTSVGEHRKLESVGHTEYISRDIQRLNDKGQIYQLSDENHFHLMPQSQNNGESSMKVTSNDQPSRFGSEDFGILLNSASESNMCNDEQGGLKKLDSFGRWMNKEIGRDCDDSLMASDSAKCWSTLDTQTDDKEVSSLSRHMQLDVDSLGPSLSQEQFFSILDFSPDWAYSGVGTKVLITGTFLGSIKHPSSTKWCCMFGEVEVAAEVLTSNSLRCEAPPHAAGRFPFYITCSDRLACSEVRQFEYREKPSEFTSSTGVRSEPEVHLQVRLAKMLSLGVDKRRWDCSVEECEKSSPKNKVFSIRTDEKNEWLNIEKSSGESDGSCENPREALIEKLLKEKLYDWLDCKAHEEGKGPNTLDDEGQGIIHLAAALGYEWAMQPLVAAGVNPSFRDARGRTGLHWAAYFGREETVVTLVRLGAAPGAVEDPTSTFPEGRTAADLASSRGRKGIAGYLAESDLTTHLSLLTLNESVMDGVSATLAAEKAIEIVEEQSNFLLERDKEDDALSLRGSLAAVRNSAQAAARIQAAFRVNSFNQRQLTQISDENSDISSELVALASMNYAQKVGHFSDSLHAAAVRIQQKYRSWKGRKEYLKIRNRIVKIQAHVRGHQVRKQYKKVVWSVGIVEKAILRWRRKGTGLRGFKAERRNEDAEPKMAKADEYDFLRVGRRQKVAGVEKALARVQSMVRYPEARDQYMRLVMNFQKSKIRDEENESSDFQASKERAGDKDLLATMTD